MDQHDWISQWTQHKRNAPMESKLADCIMKAVTVRRRKSVDWTSWIDKITPGIPLFGFRSAQLATGTAGGFLRIAVFLYVLLFIC
jgi:hypothetical protein